jgi:MFS family permease
LGFFRRPAYCAVNANGLVMGFVTIGLLFVFALFFQQVQGKSAIAAGLRFLPLTVAFTLTGPLVGRVIDRIGHRAPMAAGAALLATGALLLLRVHPGSGYGAVWWPFAIVGAGYGLLSTPMAAAVLGAVPRERAGMASSTNLTARLAGGVFGVAVLGALLPAGNGLHAHGGQAHGGQAHGGQAQGGQAYAVQFTAGLHAAMIIAAGVAVAGAVLAATLIPAARNGRSDP